MRSSVTDVKEWMRKSDDIVSEIINLVAFNDPAKTTNCYPHHVDEIRKGVEELGYRNVEEYCASFPAKFFVDAATGVICLHSEEKNRVVQRLEEEKRDNERTNHMKLDQVTIDALASLFTNPPPQNNIVKKEEPEANLSVKKADCVHFKIAHEGKTRRFAVSRGDSDLVGTVKQRVEKIIGNRVSHLFWRDEESLIVLECEEDMNAAIDFAEAYRTPACILIEATVDEKEMKMEEEMGMNESVCSPDELSRAAIENIEKLEQKYADLAIEEAIRQNEYQEEEDELKAQMDEWMRRDEETLKKLKEMRISNGLEMNQNMVGDYSEQPLKEEESPEEKRLRNWNANDQMRIADDEDRIEMKKQFDQEEQKEIKKRKSVDGEKKKKKKKKPLLFSESDSESDGSDFYQVSSSPKMQDTDEQMARSLSLGSAMYDRVKGRRRGTSNALQQITKRILSKEKEREERRNKKAMGIACATLTELIVTGMTEKKRREKRKKLKKEEREEKDQEEVDFMKEIEEFEEFERAKKLFQSRPAPRKSAITKRKSKKELTEKSIEKKVVAEQKKLHDAIIREMEGAKERRSMEKQHEEHEVQMRKHLQSVIESIENASTKQAKFEENMQQATSKAVSTSDGDAEILDILVEESTSVLDSMQVLENKLDQLLMQPIFDLAAARASPIAGLAGEIVSRCQTAREEDERLEKEEKQLRKEMADCFTQHVAASAAAVANTCSCSKTARDAAWQVERWMSYKEGDEATEKFKKDRDEFISRGEEILRIPAHLEQNLLQEMIDHTSVEALLKRLHLLQSLVHNNIRMHVFQEHEVMFTENKEVENEMIRVIATDLASRLEKMRRTLASALPQMREQVIVARINELEGQLRDNPTEVVGCGFAAIKLRPILTTSVYKITYNPSESGFEGAFDRATEFTVQLKVQPNLKSEAAEKSNDHPMLTDEQQELLSKLFNTGIFQDFDKMVEVCLTARNLDQAIEMMVNE